MCDSVIGSEFTSSIQGDSVIGSEFTSSRVTVKGSEFTSSIQGELHPLALVQEVFLLGEEAACLGVNLLHSLISNQFPVVC